MLDDLLLDLTHPNTASTQLTVLVSVWSPCKRQKTAQTALFSLP